MWHPGEKSTKPRKSPPNPPCKGSKQTHIGKDPTNLGKGPNRPTLEKVHQIDPGIHFPATQPDPALHLLLLTWEDQPISTCFLSKRTNCKPCNCFSTNPVITAAPVPSNEK